MNIEYYESFERELEAGLKKQATNSIKKFVNSFKDNDEISTWVWSYLPNLEKNRHSCIRYEIFIELVYPILKEGFESNDYRSTLWLGKLIQNIYQTKGIFEELGSLVEMDFYRKCYEIDPSNSEGKELLLKSILYWLSHCEHEWPAGILYAMDGATLEQCKIIKKEADFALSIACNENDRYFVNLFLNKLNLYEERLNKQLN
ncbi:hypothetical protein [Psychromonas aquimarina]|uniref:hypothetical protein n=1 Tax=Psychromonas aquimarina TaxID=444919 RepID=UPI00041AF010|nr:hypothetical protein [Psychromonas aquimarina]